MLSCMVYLRPSGLSGRVLDVIAIYNTPENHMLCGVGGGRAFPFLVNREK